MSTSSTPTSSATVEHLKTFIPLITGHMRLKDLVRAVRACKTAADERAVIAKESAAIRSAFREENVEIRHRSIAKLLYIHMLGYPAYFGQVECLKLTASPRFTDKRLGYLATMVLLDENQEVLTLITNNLKTDLNYGSNLYIQGIALHVLGTVSSADMVRDLATDVERLIANGHSSSSSYSYSAAHVQRKAALCAVRIVRKIPELAPTFLPHAIQLVIGSHESTQHHALVLAGVTLLLAILQEMPPLQSTAPLLSQLPALQPCVTAAVKLLRNLTQVGFSPEYDIGGVSDPFLQIALLKFLTRLGTHDRATSDLMSDVLALVASQGDATLLSTSNPTNGTTSTTTASASFSSVKSNAANAVRYEAVRAILSIEADSSLRLLAINLLARFLLSNPKDIASNNLRYVALHLLSQCVSVDRAAVQRHQGVLLSCLEDPDVSIQLKAVGLCIQLTQSENIEFMMEALIGYLESALSNDMLSKHARANHRRSEDGDEDASTTSTATQDNNHSHSHSSAFLSQSRTAMQLCLLAEKYAVSPVWHLEVLTRLLTLSGADLFLRPDVLSHYLSLLQRQSASLQQAIVHLLYQWVVTKRRRLWPMSDMFLQAAIWSFGEYSELLMKDKPPLERSVSKNSIIQGSSPGIQASLLVALLTALLKDRSGALSLVTKGYVLTALAKLYQRLMSHPTSNSNNNRTMTKNSIQEEEEEDTKKAILSVLAQYRASMNADWQQRSLEYHTILEHMEDTRSRTSTVGHLIDDHDDDDDHRHSNHSHESTQRENASTTVKNDTLWRNILDRMPMAETVMLKKKETAREKKAGKGKNRASQENEEEEEEEEARQRKGNATGYVQQRSTVVRTGQLLDLMGDDEGEEKQEMRHSTGMRDHHSVHHAVSDNKRRSLHLLEENEQQGAVLSGVSASTTSNTTVMDLLGDLFRQQNSVSNSGELVGDSREGVLEIEERTSQGMVIPEESPLTMDEVVFFEDEDLCGVLSGVKIGARVEFQVTLSKVDAMANVLMKNIVFQAAVPKQCQLEMRHPTGTMLDPETPEIVQKLTMMLPHDEFGLKLRWRLLYQQIQGDRHREEDAQREEGEAQATGQRQHQGDIQEFLWH